MFSFSIDGFDRISVGYAQLASISPDTILEYVVLPAAEILKQAMQESAQSLMNVVSGALSNSIKVKPESSRSGNPAALVSPDNNKHPKSVSGKRRPRSQGKSHGNYSGTNAEIGYILEYGSARIPGRHWIEAAIREAEKKIYAVMEEAWYHLLDQLAA